MVAAFESGYHGGIDVATATLFGQTHSSILAAPVRTHSGQVQILDAAFDLLPASFAITDPMATPTTVVRGGRDPAPTVIPGRSHFDNGAFVG
jgi:hypothetical protein